MADELNKPLFDFSRRSSGVLLHLTSLPGKHGSGDLGNEAHRFAELLGKAGQTWWQMLPVGPPGKPPSCSPYDSMSAFAGSPWLVSVSRLAGESLLSGADIKPLATFRKSRIDFSAVAAWREEKLRRAFETFMQGNGLLRNDFDLFCRKNEYWLRDYALFMALRRESGNKPWTSWDSGLRRRLPDNLARAGERLAGEVCFHSFVQFKFSQQWQALHDVSRRSGVGLIGDIPIFAGHDSADVWSHQELFQLLAGGKPARISGYPPDRFNPDGQYWGHPQYEWENHLSTGFDWWCRRFERMFDLFDALRIDHFLGFSRTWSIRGSAATARNGKWVKSPGTGLFSAVEERLGSKPMIAEDLGLITAADIELRDRFGLLPTRIFQFGFGSEGDSSSHLPHSYNPQCAAYTGNHDTNTIAGWFRSLSPSVRRMLLDYTGGHPSSVSMDCIRTTMCSAAGLVIIPVQDLLGLGSRGRMNVPGTVHGNWIWRMQSELPEGILKNLGIQTRIFGRLPGK